VVAGEQQLRVGVAGGGAEFELPGQFSAGGVDDAQRAVVDDDDPE
jgi:hypothetical protein